jgi:integrase
LAVKERRANKRSNGEGSGRACANGTWEWRVHLEDGRRISAYGKTQGEAKRKCLDKARQAELGVDLKRTRQTVGKYLNWWLTDVVQPSKAGTTHSLYEITARLHIIPELGRVELGRLTPQGVQTLLRKKEREGLSPRSVAIVRAVLRTALNHALRLGAVERNVAALVDVPRQVRAERSWLTPAQARVFLDAVVDDRLAALYRMALSLGMRQGELIGLRWQDVDLEAGRLRVTRALDRAGDGQTFKEPKTDRSRRTLDMPASVIAALRVHWDRQQFERQAAGRRWQESGLVFVTPVGTALDPANLLKAFKRHLKDAGLPDMRFHDLRHSAASMMLTDGLSLNVVSDILGHSLTSTTVDIYAHVAPAARREAAAAMDRLLGQGH